MSFPSSIRFQLKPYPNKHDFFFYNDHYQHDNLVLALQHFPKHMIVKYYSLTSFFLFLGTDHNVHSCYNIWENKESNTSGDMLCSILTK